MARLSSASPSAKDARLACRRRHRRTLVSVAPAALLGRLGRRVVYALSSDSRRCFDCDGLCVQCLRPVARCSHPHAFGIQRSQPLYASLLGNRPNASVSPRGAADCPVVSAGRSITHRSNTWPNLRFGSITGTSPLLGYLISLIQQTTESATLKPSFGAGSRGSGRVTVNREVAPKPGHFMIGHLQTEPESRKSRMTCQESTVTEEGAMQFRHSKEKEEEQIGARPARWSSEFRRARAFVCLTFLATLAGIALNSQQPSAPRVIQPTLPPAINSFPDPRDQLEMRQEQNKKQNFEAANAERKKI